MTDLKELAIKYGSDKWASHWYAQHYDRHFAAYRAQEVRVLEIGIGGYADPAAGGESLRMWQEYFPHGLIVGLDIFDKSKHRAERIHTVQGSQVDVSLLGSLISRFGPFDLIVDDGSHQCEHVIASFEYLFPRGLRDGGVYAVEDVQTSYWPATGGGLGEGSKSSSVNYFMRLANGVNWPEMHRPHQEPTFFERNVFGVHFYHNLIFVDKHRSDETSTIVNNNVVPLGLRSPIGARALRALEKAMSAATSVLKR